MDHRRQVDTCHGCHHHFPERVSHLPDSRQFCPRVLTKNDFGEWAYRDLNPLVPQHRTQISLDRHVMLRYGCWAGREVRQDRRAACFAYGRAWVRGAA